MKTNMLMILALLALGGAAQAANVVVLAEGTGRAELTAPEIRDMYLGRKTLWENGARVRICLMRGIGADDRFYRDLLKRDERAFNAYWVRRLFSGDGVPPTMVTTSQELRAFLDANPGGICYASEGIAGEQQASVKRQALPSP